MKVERYLITLQVSQVEYLHCYLIAANKRWIERASSRMIDIVEEAGGTALPVILCTRLGDGDEVVRQCLCELVPEAAETLKAADDFHISIFAMKTACPWNAKLMELH